MKEKAITELLKLPLEKISLKPARFVAEALISMNNALHEVDTFK